MKTPFCEVYVARGFCRLKPLETRPNVCLTIITHSLTSENKNELPKRYWTETNIKFLSFERKSFFLYVGNFILLFAKFNVMIIPWHECPSPVYPTLQVHLWEPSMFVQFALTPQAWILLRHSSISGSKNDIDIE